MKRFLIHTVLFAFLVIVTAIAVFYQADGYTDPYYLRFTDGKKTSLILGDSRSAQGILPQVLNKELGRNNIYNYSFNIGHSPYGQVYFESIKEKIKTSADTNGIYILGVDPWSISSVTEDPEDFLNFRENDLVLSNSGLMTFHPNIKYLLVDYANPYIEILRSSKNTYLHKNGWLEVLVDDDSLEVNDRINEKVKIYQDNLENYNFSKTRLHYLKETIRFLKKRGSVYLVRLPVHPEIHKIDNDLMEDFNSRIQLVSGELGVPFMDLSEYNEEFDYTDGNHLYKESGEEVSRLIANWIKNHEDK